jgi:outer membrane protein assembly factor BamB
MGFTASGPNADAVRPVWSARLEGRVTAQTLVVRRTLYVVTTAGKVYAFAPNGKTRWVADVGSLAHTCRQLDRYGITATPVADPGRGVLYVGDAFGLLHAFDLDSGRERPGWPVEVFRWYRHDHIWGALALVGDSVYVAAGAYCDQLMEGKLARVSVTTREVDTWISVPLGLGGGGGIWGWGGVAYSPTRNSLYVVTGNAFDGGENTGDAFSEYAAFGEHLVELSTELGVRSSSHPDEIVAHHDLDFTGSPLLVSKSGCGELVVAANKNGRLYVWHADAVGDGPLGAVTLHAATPSRPLLTQPAYSPRLRSIYVVTNVSLARIAIDARCRPQIVWTVPLQTRSLNGSPTVAGDTVWFATSGRSPRLLGIDARSGAIRAHLPLGTLTLVAPTVVGGRVYVGSFFGRLYAFGAR